MVIRMGSSQFAGTTQLLPLGASSDQAQQALAALAKHLGGKIPVYGHERLKLAREAMVWKEYRASTKNLLAALTNSLMQCMPQGWNLSLLKPSNLLAPCGKHGERHSYLQQEQAFRADLAALKLSFVQESGAGLRFPDFYVNEDFYKLVFAADEGTEAGFRKGKRFNYVFF